MQKKLIALAVAGVFAAPAFAATSNVDVYGVMNVGVFDFDSDVSGDDDRVSVTSNASRIGFKGTEDLGGGLSAIWQIESGITADEGSGTWANRNTFLGLSSKSFGTVLAGKHDTPMKLLGRSVDNFGDSPADSRNILGANAISASSSWDLRTNNTIAYVSPNFSGLTVVAGYVTDYNANGNAADNNDFDAYSVNAVYKNGPFMLGGGYEQHNATSNDANIWRVVAKFDMGDFSIAGQYDSQETENTILGSVGDRQAWGVFANYKMGAITLKGSYVDAEEYDGADSTGGSQWAVGVDYAMSKRTTLYALYASTDNDSGACFGLGTGAGDSDQVGGCSNTANYATNAGSDPSVFGIGMKHSF